MKLGKIIELSNIARYNDRTFSFMSITWCLIPKWFDRNRFLVISKNNFMYLMYIARHCNFHEEWMKSNVHKHYLNAAQNSNWSHTRDYNVNQLESFRYSDHEKEVRWKITQSSQAVCQLPSLSKVNVLSTVILMVRRWNMPVKIFLIVKNLHCHSLGKFRNSSEQIISRTVPLDCFFTQS